MISIPPLYTARIIALSISTAASAFGIASALYARDRSVRSRDRVVRTVNGLNLGIFIDVDISDVYNSGLATGASQAVLFMTSTLCLLLLYLSRSGRRAISNRTLPLQVAAFCFTALFSLTAVSTVTALVFTRDAKVTTLLPNGDPVPQEQVDMLTAQLGFEATYKKKSYLVLLSAGPWVGTVAGLIPAVVTFMAWKRLKAWRSSDNDQEDREKNLVHYNTRTTAASSSKYTS